MLCCMYSACTAISSLCSGEGVNFISLSAYTQCLIFRLRMETTLMDRLHWGLLWLSGEPLYRGNWELIKCPGTHKSDLNVRYQIDFSCKLVIENKNLASFPFVSWNWKTVVEWHIWVNKPYLTLYILQCDYCTPAYCKWLEYAKIGKHFLHFQINVKSCIKYNHGTKSAALRQHLLDESLILKRADNEWRCTTHHDTVFISIDVITIDTIKCQPQHEANRENTFYAHRIVLKKAFSRAATHLLSLCLSLSFL